MSPCRSQIGVSGMGPGSAQRRHPNWGHPDHDACGTGFVTRLGGAPSYEIIQISLAALERLTHRGGVDADGASGDGDRKSTRLNSSHVRISYAVFCLKKKKTNRRNREIYFPNNVSIG